MMFDMFKQSSSRSSSSSSSISSVAISGSSGLIGTELTKRLQQKGINVIKIKVNDDEITTSDTLEGVDAIIHLAGENVASGDDQDGLLRLTGRWTDRKKDKIVNSRVQGTRALVSAISKLKKKPKTFISASAVGFYGYNNVDTVFDDVSNRRKGEGFLADVCDQWEEEVFKAKDLKNIRVASMRFAVVLSKKGGIISKLLPIFFLGAGGNIGNGDQPFSFVTLNDACRVIEYVLEKKSIEGPINVASPEPTDNAGFTRAFGSALQRPAIIPIPEIAVKLIFGQMGEEMLLGGQKTFPAKLTKSGFVFENSNIEKALIDVVK